MAYQTGSVAGPEALLQAMSTFLAANGWTVDDDSVEGNGRKLTIHRGAQYYAFRASDGVDTVSTIGVPSFESNSVETGIWMVGGRGITGPNWYDITGRVTTSALARYLVWMDFNNQAGPFNYHMFAHTTPHAEFYVVAEYTPGRWTWLMGSETMNLLGAWGQATNPHTGAFMGASRGQYWTNRAPDDTGGFGVRGPFFDVGQAYPMSTFIQSVEATTHIERETFNGYVDASTGRSDWGSVGNRFSGSLPERYGYTGRHYISTARGMGSNLIRAAPTQHNLADVLCPFLVMRERRGYHPLTGGNTWNQVGIDMLARSLFGYPSHIYYVDLSNLNPADTLTIGADTWRVFPDHYKGQLDQFDTWSLESGSFQQSGFAIRQ